MGHKIKVLGIEIDDYTIEESMAKVEEYMENDRLNTVGMITTALLMEAGEDPVLKRCIERLDMSVIADMEVLNAAGITDERRQEEVQENEFIGTLLMYAVNCQKTVYLLVETSKELEELEEHFKQEYPELTVVGMSIIEAGRQDTDAFINDINSVSPDILLAFLTSPNQEQFAEENGKRLNAKLYIEMGKYKKMKQSLGLKPGWLSKLVDKTLFKRMVTKYKEEKGES